IVGTAEAATKASVAPVAPNSQAMTCSRTRPSRRLATLPSMMTIAAVAIWRRVDGAEGGRDSFPPPSALEGPAADTTDVEAGRLGDRHHRHHTRLDRIRDDKVGR